MAEDRFIPSRRCIACRTSFSKTDLIRFAVTKDGLQFDSNGQLPGRGLYICRNERCINAAFSKNCFAKSLRRSVSKDELNRLYEETKNIN